jgi:hypothetical protein
MDLEPNQIMIISPLQEIIAILIHKVETIHTTTLKKSPISIFFMKIYKIYIPNAEATSKSLLGPFNKEYPKSICL